MPQSTLAAAPPGGAAERIEHSLQVLEHALSAYAPATLGTAFNIEGAVLLHLVATRLPQHLPALDVFSIDTGRLPDETHAYAAQLTARYGKPIRFCLPPPEPIEDFVHSQGADAFYRSEALRRQCCALRKRSALSRALAGKSAWIVGLRREQSAERAGVRAQMADPGLGVEKFAPLAHWTRRAVEDFATAEQVPIHPLYARGYLSIGCSPCTRAVGAGEAERAGRWWWESPDAGKECGLHPATSQAPLHFHPRSGHTEAARNPTESYD